MGRLLVLSAILSLAAGLSHATVPAPRKAAAQPKAELAAAEQAAVQQGWHAELPPHISTLLGLTNEEKCAVMQGVLRSSDRTQGIDVTEKDHNDIVIFVVDETTKDQTLYLTSPGGALRKMLSIKQGVGYVVKPGKADLEAFQREKQMWEKRFAGHTPAK